MKSELRNASPSVVANVERSAPARESSDPATLPALLASQVRASGARIAMREKKFGIWQTYSWLEVSKLTRDLACGLSQAGVSRGDHVALIGGNRPRL
ncbi:hypothetical protein LJR084_006454 [Variovorax sp. LjRoot84]|uniref:hypothetical protein n=1 Tax=Variovorax sp. LjRoot84 TaxID=3342340 RepID=UPI003ED05B21